MTTQERLEIRPILGTLFVAVGATVLLGRLTLFFTDAWTELIGALPAIGMAILKACTTLSFAGRDLFPVVLGVLVSFWPLVLIAGGVGLLIRSQLGKRRATQG